MATTNFTVAVELGSSHISGIAGRKAPDGSLEVLAYACQDSTSFVHKGVVYNIEKASQALGYIISQLESQLHSSIAKVYVGIGGQSLRTVVNTVNHTLQEKGIISAKLVDSLCDENREMSIVDMDVLDVAPQEYKIDHMLQADPVGVTGQHITAQYLNIVARSSLKKNIELSFEQARMPVADFIIAPVALAQLMLAENDRRAGCALVDFGAGTTTVLVYKNNILRYLCVLPLGGNNITRDISTLQLEDAEAEQLKLDYGDALYEEPAADVAEAAPVCTLSDGRELKLAELNHIVGARAEEIVANVWNQLQLSGYETSLFRGVCFTGGGALLPHLEELFHKQPKADKVKVRVARTPGCQVNCPDGLIPSGVNCNTLLGLLAAAGNDNCCVQEPVRQQQPQTADMFGNDENLKMQEEENRRKLEEERRRKEKGRQLKSEEKQKKEEERRKKEQARKNKPNRFASLFGKLTNAVLDDEEEDK